MTYVYGIEFEQELATKSSRQKRITSPATFREKTASNKQENLK